MSEALFPIKVMEPIRVENQPVGEYLYQVKWDGMRWITYKSKQGTFISTPLLWDEVVQGVNPDDFHVRSFRERLIKVGDLSTVMSQNNGFSLILHCFT